MIEQGVKSRVNQRAAGQLMVGAALALGMFASGGYLHQSLGEQSDAYQVRVKARTVMQNELVAPHAEAVNKRIAPVALRMSEGYALQPAPVLDRVALQPLESFTAAHIRDAENQALALDCMARAIYYEARSENLRGQKAVAEVVINRVRSPYYPSTICGVVYEGSSRVTGCQFTFTCDGSENRAPRGREWRQAQKVAKNALMGIWRPVTDEATHYHANYVDPYWAPTLLKTEKIGRHIFYRSPYHGDLPLRQITDA